MSEPTQPKTRQLPRVWKRFFRLANGDTFFVGRRIYTKRLFVLGRELVGIHNICSKPANTVFVPPWRSVRTTLLVRDVRLGGKSSLTATEIENEIA